MNKDQAIAAITGLFKVIGTILALHGAQHAAAALNDPSLIEASAGLLITLVSFFASHKYNATPADPGPAAGAGLSRPPLVILAFLLAGTSGILAAPVVYTAREQAALDDNRTLLAVNTAQTPLIAPMPNSDAPAAVTNAPTWLDKVLALSGSITNIAISPYGTYAPKPLPGTATHWGGGIMGVWNVTQMAGLGMALDWLGQLSLVSVNVTLQAPFHPAPQRAPTWVAAPFVLVGGEKAYSGAGNFNGSAGLVSDIGAYTRFGHWLGGNFNIGGTYGKWTIGDFSQTRYHIFVGWMYGF